MYLRKVNHCRTEAKERIYSPMWIKCKPQGISAQNLPKRSVVCFQGMGDLFFFLMQFLCPFYFMGNQMKITCSSNSSRGRSLMKKILEKIIAFTRFMHLLHSHSASQLCTLFNWLQWLKPREDRLLQVQLNPGEKGWNAKKKKIPSHHEWQPKQKANTFACESETGFVSFPLP